MSDFSLGELLSARAGEGIDLYGRYSNPRFVQILKILGFDREWRRAEGAYLYDRDGTKYLDWLGGFGMYNVGRNNATVRRALADVLELRTPSLPQLGLSDLPGLLAEALVAVAPASTDRVLFVNSGAEAVEAAVKLGRAATGRPRVVAVENGFHGLTLGALSVNGSASQRERFLPLLPQVSWGTNPSQAVTIADLLATSNKDWRRAQTRMDAAFALAQLGQFDEAVTLAEEAVALDQAPNAPGADLKPQLEQIRQMEKAARPVR